MKRIVGLSIVTAFLSAAAVGMASARGSEQGSDHGILLTLYTEEYQNAFYMLIPKGWKAKGGMIPSGLPRNDAN